MPYKLTWLADVLRAAGCTVVEEAGWKDRGRGEMGTVRGVLLHHTGAGSEKGLLALIRDGRGGANPLAGPLSQLFLTDKGVFHVVAAGRCNHAGAGSWHGITAGNSETIGIEAMNAGDGKDVWEPEQMRAYLIGVAAILRHIKADSNMAAGHKEYATPRGRKIDPSFDMVTFREGVDNLLADMPLVHDFTPVTVDPKRAMLRKGDRGNSVKEMQRLLNAAGATPKLKEDGDFGPASDKAVRAWQKANGLVPDGLFGPASWAKILG